MFTYGKTHLLPLLTRVWPIPDDLTHAAGQGNLDRVKAWFDAAGKPALGDLTARFPKSYRQFLVTGGPVRRRRLRADGPSAWR